MIISKLLLRKFVVAVKCVTDHHLLSTITSVNDDAIIIITRCCRLQRDPPVTVEDLFEDIKDGTKLLYLLETLTGQRLVSISFGRHLRLLPFHNPLSGCRRTVNDSATVFLHLHPSTVACPVFIMVFLTSAL